MDPMEDMLGIFMSQRLFDGAGPPLACADFWNLAYQAIDD
jgi:hypothetical protein